MTSVAMDRVESLPFERLQQSINIRHGQQPEQLVGDCAILLLRVDLILLLLLLFLGK